MTFKLRNHQFFHIHISATEKHLRHFEINIYLITIFWIRAYADGDIHLNVRHAHEINVWNFYDILASCCNKGSTLKVLNQAEIKTGNGPRGVYLLEAKPLFSQRIFSPLVVRIKHSFTIQSRRADGIVRCAETYTRCYIDERNGEKEEIRRLFTDSAAPGK